MVCKVFVPVPSQLCDCFKHFDTSYVRAF